MATSSSGLFGMTSVATPASAEAVTQAKLCGKVAVVGLATPNAMKPYVNADCVKSVVLWNPVDLGYAAVYVTRAVVDGKLKAGATRRWRPASSASCRSSTAAKSCSGRPSSTRRPTSATSTSERTPQGRPEVQRSPLQRRGRGQATDAAVWPNRMRLDSSVSTVGCALTFFALSYARTTAGRFLIVSNQRLRCGKSSRLWP